MAGAERIETSGPDETERVAARLAAQLGPGDLVLVCGDLGSGKTTFVRGACRALGVRGRVTSPTFTLARRYEDGRMPISHLDLHRLEGSAGEDPALLEEELGPGRLAFVEWPEAHADALAGRPAEVCVRLEHLGGDRRAITIERRSR